MNTLQKIVIQAFVPSDQPFAHLDSALTRFSEDLDGYWTWNARPEGGERTGCFEIRVREDRAAAPAALEIVL